MKNKFSFTENVMGIRKEINEIIENYELKNLPCATVDSKGGLVLEVNCFPAAAEIYKEGFVTQTLEAAIKMADLLQKELRIILITEDFTRHIPYQKNVEKWALEIEKTERIQKVERKTFRELEKEKIEADLLISNSDLRFKDFAIAIINSDIPCFPSPHAGWWKRSKIGTSKEIDELCTTNYINPHWVQPDYRYVIYEEFNKNILKELKEKTIEMTQLYPEGVFVKHAAGTQGYGCNYISTPEDYEKKDVRDALSFQRGFRGSKIHGLLIQRCVKGMKFPLQSIDNELRLLKDEPRSAELYFIMVADENLRASIHDIFIRIGINENCYNINKPGEIFKNLSQNDLKNLDITEYDLEASKLTAQLSYVATDIQIEKLKNSSLEEKLIYSL